MVRGSESVLFKNSTDPKRFSVEYKQNVEVVSVFVSYVYLALCFKDLITNMFLGFSVMVLSVLRNCEWNRKWIMLVVLFCVRNKLFPGNLSDFPH